MNMASKQNKKEISLLEYDGKPIAIILPSVSDEMASNLCDWISPDEGLASIKFISKEEMLKYFERE
jgi:hypothetical protein